MAFWKDSMINRLSNIINRNRSVAKLSQVLCSSPNTSGPVIKLIVVNTNHNEGKANHDWQLIK